MNKNYLKIIHNLKEKDNLTQSDVFASLDFEERKEIFLNRENGFFNYSFIQKCNELGIYLFSESEFALITADSNNDSLLYAQILLPKDIFFDKLVTKAKEGAEELNYFIGNPNFASLSNSDITHLLDLVILTGKRDSEIASILTSLVKVLKNDLIKDAYLEKLRLYQGKDKKFLRDKLFIPVESFESDEFKKKWLRRLPIVDRAMVISSLKDDHQKLIYSLPYRSWDKELITLSMKDQELVKKLAFNPAISKKVLICITDEKVREDYFRRLHTMIKSEDKGQIVASFSTREKQLELSKFLKTEKARLALASNTKVLTDGDLWRIAKKFRSSKRKLAATCNMSDIRLKHDIFARLDNHEEIINMLSDVKDEETFNILTDILSEHELKRVYDYEMVENNPKFLFILLSKIKDKHWLMRNIERITLYNYMPPNIDHFCQIYAKAYKLNLEHLKTFTKTFGYGTFKYISSERIRDAINLNEEDFKKYMQIFNSQNLVCNEITVKNLLFALAQDEYKSQNDAIVNMRSYVVDALEENDFKSAKTFIMPLIEKYHEEIASFLGVDPKIEVNTLANLFLEKIAKKDPKVASYFSDLVDKFINQHRSSETKRASELYFYNIPGYLNEKSINNVLIYYCDVKEVRRILNNYYMYFSEEEKHLINSEILDKILEFKKNPGRIKVDEKFKHQLNLFSGIIKKAMAFGIESVGVFRMTRSYPGMDYDLDYNAANNQESLFSLLQGVNPKQLSETLFKDPETYKELLEFLNRSKILGSGIVARNIFETTDLALDESLLGNLVNYYPTIKEKIATKDKRVGIIDYLLEADYFNSESNRYQNLFGKGTFRLIKSDPTPNKSEYTRKERLKVAPELVKGMYRRKYVAIPPQNRNYKTSTGKTLNVKIGDLQNTSNLVLGELTGACMRIGGVASSLHRFCLLEDNGFHLVFSNPKTSKFVSRVSGFRNGNTVFFNELRYSVTAEYTEDDLYDCLKKAAKQIIEDTKDSKMPVENVVVSPGCALTDFSFKPDDLGIQNIKKGLPNMYTNVTSKAVILATSSKEGRFAPVKLNPDCPKYEGLRVEPKLYQAIAAKHQIDHLRTLKLFLSGKKLGEIDIPNEEITSCYATRHWGVYIGADGKLKTVAVDDSKETLSELKEFVAKLKSEPKLEEGLNAKNR